MTLPPLRLVLGLAVGLIIVLVVLCVLNSLGFLNLEGLLPGKNAPQDASVSVWPAVWSVLF